MRKPAGSSSYMRLGIRKPRVIPWKVKAFSVRKDEVEVEADLEEEPADLVVEAGREVAEVVGRLQSASATTARRLGTTQRTARKPQGAMSVWQVGTKATNVQAKGTPHQILPRLREGKVVFTMWNLWKNR